VENAGVSGSVGGGRGDSAGDDADAAAANERAADGGGVCNGLNGALCEAEDDGFDSGVEGAAADAEGFEDAGAGGAGAGATGGGVSAMRTPQCGHCHDSDCCARRRRSSGEWSRAPIAPLPRVGMKPIRAARMVRTVE
jgi:hypothetical protein